SRRERRKRKEKEQMSSFVVGNETIDKILHFFKWCETQPEWSEFKAISAKLKESGYTNLSILGQQMLSLNIRAVNSRYCEDSPLEKYDFAYCERPPKPVEAYKALH